MLETVRTNGNTPFQVAVIHGGPGAIGSVAPVAKKLGETRGEQEPLQTATSLDGQVEELLLVIEQNPTKPVLLIGQSWRAKLSYLLAATYPTLVRKLVLVSSGPFEEHSVPLIAENRLRRLSVEFLHLAERLNTAETPENRVSLSRPGTLAHTADSYGPVDMPAETKALDLPENRVEMYQGVWSEAAELRPTGQPLTLSGHIPYPVVAMHGDSDPHPVAGIQEPLSTRLKLICM